MTRGRALGAIVLAQGGLSWLLGWHLGAQLNPDAVAYGRAATYWYAGDTSLAVNATWGVVGPWLAVPGLVLGLTPPDALRAGQVVAAGAATLGADALLGCFRVPWWPRIALTCVAALYGAVASAVVLTADAAFVASFMWMCWALLTPRHRIAGLPRPFVAGVFGAVCYLARPIGLPMGLAMIAGSEGLRAAARGGAARVRRPGLLALVGWAAIAVPWVTILSVHYGAFTLTHSASVVRVAVGPHTGHPWNLPSFTRLHRPPTGRVTTWEDPGLLSDATLDWSPLGSRAEWEHQLALVRRNLWTMVATIRHLDGDGGALASLLLVPLLGLWRPRVVGWREPWLALAPALHVAALAPLHVEERYLWPVVIVSLAAVGALVARIDERIAQEAGGSMSRRVLGVTATLLLVGPLLVRGGIVAAATAATPGRGERTLVASWIPDVAGTNGAVVSWSAFPEKALDPEGLYLAWGLGRPWLGNVADDGHDLAQAQALGADVLVVKTGVDGVRPPWIDESWRLVVASDVRGVTLRDGRYAVLVRR